MPYRTITWVTALLAVAGLAAVAVLVVMRKDPQRIASGRGWKASIVGAALALLTAAGIISTRGCIFTCYEPRPMCYDMPISRPASTQASVDQQLEQLEKRADLLEKQDQKLDATKTTWTAIAKEAQEILSSLKKGTPQEVRAKKLILRASLERYRDVLIEPTCYQRMIPETQPGLEQRVELLKKRSDLLEMQDQKLEAIAVARQDVERQLRIAVNRGAVS